MQAFLEIFLLRIGNNQGESNRAPPPTPHTVIILSKHFVEVPVGAGRTQVGGSLNLKGFFRMVALGQCKEYQCPPCFPPPFQSNPSVLLHFQVGTHFVE